MYNLFLLTALLRLVVRLVGSVCLCVGEHHVVTAQISSRAGLGNSGGAQARLVAPHAEGRWFVHHEPQLDLEGKPKSVAMALVQWRPQCLIP